MSSLPPPAVQHCYRHPQREAWRTCTRCGKVACSECLVQAAVGSHCVDCVKLARPDVKTRARYWNASQPTLVTYGLIAVNVAVFAWMAVKDPATLSGDFTREHARLGVSKLALQATHQWYRLITSGFIHFGVIHIAFNMLLLFQLGHLLEPAVGRLRFGLLYAASLLGGSLGVVLVDKTVIAGGASGAVIGLLAAAAVGLQRRGVNVWSTGIGTTLLLNLLLTFTIQGISKGGHVGGALAGAVCGLIMLAPRWRAYPKWATVAAPAAVGVAAAMASFVVAR